MLTEPVWAYAERNRLGPWWMNQVALANDSVLDRRTLKRLL